jgi:hypothetical protein
MFSNWLKTSRGGLRGSHSTSDFYSYQHSSSRRRSFTTMYEAYNRRHVYSDMLLDYSYLGDHDRFNYRRPDINYDQPPRKTLRRPRRPPSEPSLEEQPVASGSVKTEERHRSSARKLLLSLLNRARSRAATLLPENLPTVTEMVDLRTSVSSRYMRILCIN